MARRRTIGTTITAAASASRTAEKSFFFAYGQATPEGVDAAEPGLQSGIYRPIALGPALLAVTDRHKKARLLKEWHQSFQAQ